MFNILFATRGVRTSGASRPRRSTSDVARNMHWSGSELVDSLVSLRRFATEMADSHIEPPAASHRVIWGYRCRRRLPVYLAEAAVFCSARGTPTCEVLSGAANDRGTCARRNLGA